VHFDMAAVHRLCNLSEEHSHIDAGAVRMSGISCRSARIGRPGFQGKLVARGGECVRGMSGPSADEGTKPTQGRYQKTPQLTRRTGD
jgi:hypothetical protein